MPVFLEELNLWSWTGPQGCSHCSTHWFNPYGRHISSAGWARAGLKRSIYTGLLLLQFCFMRTEKERKRTHFSLSPEDEPGTWRLLWGVGCWVGLWVKKMLPPPHHAHQCLVWRCLAAVRLPKALPISQIPVLSMLLTILSQSLQTCCGRKPWPEDGQSHRRWLSLGGSSGLLFCAAISASCVFNFIFPVLQRGFLEHAVLRSSKEHQQQGKSDVCLFAVFVVFFCFPVGSCENCLNTAFQLILTQASFFPIP